MKYLLDTCVALWFFEGGTKILPGILDKLTDPENELFLSDISLLEITIKHQLGKLYLAKPPSRLIPALMSRHDIMGLPLDAGSIYRLESLPLKHRDPFDRLLVAQALTQKMTLVSPDPMIRQYEVPLAWD